MDFIWVVSSCSRKNQYFNNSELNVSLVELSFYGTRRIAHFYRICQHYMRFRETLFRTCYLLIYGNKIYMSLANFN